MKDSKWPRPLFKFNFHWRRFLKVQVSLWIFILFRGIDDKINYALLWETSRRYQPILNKDYIVARNICVVRL